MNKTRTTPSLLGNQLSKLDLAFFGPPQVRLDQQIIRFRTRKALGLLAYLALEPGLQSRDKLCALLWPEADEGQARVSLRGAVNHLNQALGIQHRLLAQQDSLGLSRDFYLDVHRLEAAFKQAGQNQEASLETTLDAAIKLYRGEFLEGFSLSDAPEFDDWVVAQRELARQWLDTVLERLCQLQADSGRLHFALETALRRMHLEVLNEAAHRQIIKLQLRLGNQKAALEAYQYCKTVLERELGLAPSPETQVMVAQITPSPKTDSPSKETIQLPQQTQLVGRVDAWEKLQQAWQSGQSIFISSEAGVGKTRLIQEFLASKSGQILYRSARPGETSVPYASLAENLRQLLQQTPNLSLKPWIRQELSRILPELGEASQKSVGTQMDKLRFLDAVAEVLSVSFTQLTALVWDDLQFVDGASLETFVYLNSRFAKSGESSKTKRLISLYRPSEVAPSFVQEVRMLLEQDTASLIELQPLEPEDVGQMLADLMPENPNHQQLGSTLHGFTGGNPMFVLETVRSLAQRGGLENLTAERFETRRRVAGLPRSPKVTAVIGRRLERLSTSARDLSRIAAILGGQFTLDLAAKILNASAFALAPAFEELEAAQVWKGQKFSHDLLFETTLEQIPESLKPILHGRVLDVLEDLSVPAAVLADHAIAAGRQEASFKYSYQAGMG